MDKGLCIGACKINSSYTTEENVSHAQKPFIICL